MNLSIKSVAITAALLCGGCLLALGLINLAVPSYGAAFLNGVASIYPGFRHSHTLVDVLLGTAYGAIDGALGGAFFAWLYNSFRPDSLSAHH